MIRTASHPIAIHLIAGVLLAAVGFSGGVALSRGGAVPGLAGLFPVAGAWSSASCAGVDDGTEERAAVALRHATEGDEEGWCLLR